MWILKDGGDSIGRVRRGGGGKWGMAYGERPVPLGEKPNMVIKEHMFQENPRDR